MVEITDVTPEIRDWEFPVEKRDLFFYNEEKEQDVVTHMAVIRTDTGAVLGVVGKDYTILDHKDIVDMADLVLARHNHTRKVILTKNGARMFAKYRLTDYEIEIRPNDKVNPTITVMNSYDGSMRLTVEAGAFRLVCTNGLIVGKKLLRKVRKHLGASMAVLEHLEKHLLDAVAILEAVAPVWQKWGTQTISKEQGVEILTDLGIPKKYEEAILENWNSLHIPVRTVWEAYNSITWVLSHNEDLGQVSVERVHDISFKAVSKFEENVEKMEAGAVPVPA